MDLSITISACGSKFAPIMLRGDYGEQIDIARRLGFKMVELHIQDPNKIDRDLILKTLQRTGIKVSTIGTGQAFVDERLSFSNPDQEIRRRAVQRVKDQIDFANELGAKVIIGTIKGPMPENLSDQLVARKNIIECMQACSEHAESSTVGLTLEAVNRYETNFLNTAEETMKFIREIDSPVLGLHLDTFHMNLEEVSLEETLKTYAPWLSHMHLADSNRWAPGMGHLDFERIIATLKAINYQGVLAIECLPRPDAMIAARQSFNYLSPMINQAS